jgi:hypothetical protein
MRSVRDIFNSKAGVARMDDKFSTDLAAEAAKGAPPVAIAATSLAGAVDWQTWVFILTAFYLLMQIIFLVWKMIDKLRGKAVTDG